MSAIAPLVGPYIPAAGYRRGRAFREAKEVRWLGAHTAEGAKTAVELGHFFHEHTSGSSHAGIGQEGKYAKYVNYSDTAWAMPPLNEEADNVELCGFAAWSEAKWMDHTPMLDSFAHWLAWRAAVRHIPLQLLTPQDLREGHKGIVMHRTTNDVFHLSSHWDPGYHLPWHYVLVEARKIARVSTKPGVLVFDASVVKKGQLLGDSIKDGKVLKQKLSHQVGKGSMNMHTDNLGSGFRSAYREWQLKCGYRGKAADGVAGLASLTRLGRLENFKAVA